MKLKIKDFALTGDLIYIHQNFPFALQGRVQSSHNHSQREVQGALMEDNHTGFSLSDNSIKMLPLTDVKGNLEI